jgi:hypothetical protein
MLRMEIIPRTEGRLETVQYLTDPLGKVYQLIDFWLVNKAFRKKIKLEVDGEVHEIEFLLAPSQLLSSLTPGEKFGLYIGNMMQISSEVAKKRPDWVKYIAIKLHAEKFVDRGLDKSGRAKHYESMFKTIRLAGATMDENELREFISVVIPEDRSEYFKFDHEVQEFMSRNGDPSDDDKLLEVKRQYLDKHHHNLWVNRGRNQEFLAQHGFTSGYRNHAEALYSCLIDTAIDSIYLAGYFIRSLMNTGEGQRILITPPLNAFAYALTKECNGVSDIVRFVEAPRQNMSEDNIIRVRGKTKTLVALLKRLSFRIHQSELAVRDLMDSERLHLNQVITLTQKVNTEFDTTLTTASTSLELRSDPFEGSILALQEQAGEWTEEITRLSSVASAITANVARLQKLSSTLKQAI